jgi:hypothetical protein
MQTNLESTLEIKIKEIQAEFKTTSNAMQSEFRTTSNAIQAE